MKRGRKYHGCGEEYNVEKRDRGSNVIFLIILRLFKVGKRGRGRKFRGRKSRFLKNGGGEEYKVVRNFIRSCISNLDAASVAICFTPE